MPIPKYEVNRYQDAAVMMCNLLNEDPFKWNVSTGATRWEIYAVKMAEHAIMIEVMRQFGHRV